MKVFLSTLREHILIGRGGKICIIDPEKGVITTPYLDPITLVENYLCKGHLTGQDMKDLLGDYCINSVDSGTIFSDEEAARELNLSGVYRHLNLFGSASKFSEKSEMQIVRDHYLERCLHHIDSLESFRISKIDEFRSLKNSLEDIYSNA